MLRQLLLQAAQAAEAAPDSDSFLRRIIDFIDTPAPFSPFSEYLLIMFVLWLIARITARKGHTFSTQAQDVLEDKYARGELTKKAYDKFRQDATTRPKR